MKKKATKVHYVAYNPTTGEYAKNWYSSTKNFNLAEIVTYETAHRNAVSMERAHYNGHSLTEGEWEVHEVHTTITVGLDHIAHESGLAPWQMAVERVASEKRAVARNRRDRKATRRAELEAELDEMVVVRFPRTDNGG